MLYDIACATCGYHFSVSSPRRGERLVGATDDGRGWACYCLKCGAFIPAERSDGLMPDGESCPLSRPELDLSAHLLASALGNFPSEQHVPRTGLTHEAIRACVADVCGAAPELRSFDADDLDDVLAAVSERVAGCNPAAWDAYQHALDAATPDPTVLDDVHPMTLLDEAAVELAASAWATALYLVAELANRGMAPSPGA